MTMRTTLRTLLTASGLVVALSVGMVGCSTLPRVVGVETAQKVELNALRAARTALTVYSLAQDAALFYGRQTPCVADVPEFKLCRDPKVWAKIKQIDAEYTPKVLAARPLIEAGTDDVAFLTGTIAMVNEGVIKLNQAKGVAVQ